MIKSLKYIALTSIVLASCNNNDDTVVPVANSSDGKELTSGTADFSKFVSLGNSLTAGFSDNALFRDGQLGSWANILADQFKLVGGGEYKMALTNNNVGGLLFGGTPNPRFGARVFFTGTGLGVAQGAGVTPNEVFSPALSAAGPYNNVGVPGAKSFHLLSPGYGQAANLATGTANPYFVRFCPQGAGAKSMLDYAYDQTPTFFSLWIGNNDVLGYATAGGVTATQDPTNGSDITPVATFSFAYNTIINKMTTSAKGAVSNIPYVNSVPFFTTVPTNPIPGLPPTSAGQLNQLFGGINSALTASGLPTRFATLVSDDGNAATVEANPLLLIDESLINISAQITAALTPAVGAGTAAYLGSIYGQARHASNAAATRDYVLLTARSIIGTTQAGAPAPFNTVGISYPMQDNAILTASEITEIKTATDAYNAIIKAAADSKGLAFIDANLLLRNVASFGVSDSGITITSTFATGGGFSMDGVHPAPRGYALIANEFIKEINKTYGSNLKTVDIAKFKFLYGAVLGDGNK